MKRGLILGAMMLSIPCARVAAQSDPPPPPAPPPLPPAETKPALPPRDPAGVERRIDAALLRVPIKYGVFQSGRGDEKVTAVTTRDCVTRVTTSGGLNDVVDWRSKGARPDLGFTQHIGTRNQAGTLASFSAYIPGESAFSQSMGKRYEREFEELSADMTLLWKRCSAAKR